MKTILAALAVAVFGGLVLATAPEAEAMPCLHRGWQHVVQHANGNVDLDSRLHFLRGEQTTCPVRRGIEQPSDPWQDRQRDINRERYGGW